MMSYLALLGALVATASGQVLFKLGTINASARTVVVGLGSLGLATICSFIALRTLGIGLVYLATGMTHVLVLLASRYLLHEQVSRKRWIGATLVASGVLLYGISL